MHKIVAAVALVALMVLTGCATTSAPADLKGVWYSGGTTQAKKFKGCIEPSSRDFSPGDKYFYYPTRQISYEASEDGKSERGRFTVVSDDNAELYIPVRLTMQLDTKCETLRKFHEEIGSRYGAFIRNDEDLNDDGEWTSADYPEEWVDLLNDIVGKPLDATLDRIAQEYTWRELWGDATAEPVKEGEEAPESSESIRAKLEDEIEANIEQLVNEQAGGDYFTDFTVLVQKPDPVDQELKAAISAEQKAIADARAQTTKAKADELTAAAQEKLADAQAKTKQAEIRGYGGIQNYLYAQCIAEPSCGNPFRNQYLYGGTPR